MPPVLKPYSKRNIRMAQQNVFTNVQFAVILQGALQAKFVFANILLTQNIESFLTRVYYRTSSVWSLKSQSVQINFLISGASLVNSVVVFFSLSYLLQSLGIEVFAIS